MFILASLVKVTIHALVGTVDSKLLLCFVGYAIVTIATSCTSQRNDKTKAKVEMAKIRAKQNIELVKMIVSNEHTVANIASIFKWLVVCVTIAIIAVTAMLIANNI